MKHWLTLGLLLACGSATAAGPVFDTHVHLRDGAASLRDYRADAAKAGVEISGVAVMWFGGPHQAREGQADDVRAGNDQVMVLAAAEDDVVPVAVVHPYDPGAIAELERVAAGGVRVLKIHPHTQKFDAADPRVLALAKRAGELDVVVLMDNAGIVPDDHVNLFNLALRAPDTDFIFAHAGGMGFRFWNILALARTAEGVFAENIHVDISATVVLLADSPLEEEFVWTLRNIGIDRVLLGSDHPQIDIARTVAALERLGLDAAEQEKVLDGNARRLFRR